MIIEHAFSCSIEEFPTIRHNELHDIPAALLSESETANVEDGACLDVSAESFWGQTEEWRFPLAQCFCHAELDKKCMYNE